MSWIVKMSAFFACQNECIFCLSKYHYP